MGRLVAVLVGVVRVRLAAGDAGAAGLGSALALTALTTREACASSLGTG